MSQDQSAYDDGLSRNASNQSPALLVQLESLMITMHHIDEVLGWLAYIFVNRLNIQAVQFWANQRTSAQQVLFELRASTWQDQSFPGSLLTNQHVATVGKIAAEQSLFSISTRSFLLTRRRSSHVTDLIFAPDIRSCNPTCCRLPLTSQL